MITRILNDYLLVGGKNKPLYIESTKGNYDLVLPNKKLFETINWLCNYALPASGYPGADMLFFENSQGYHFNSLQTMFKSEPFANFYYNPKKLEYDNNRYIGLNQYIFNALKFEIINYFDTLDALNKGTFSSRLISIDPLTRTKKTTDYSYDEFFKTTQSLNDAPITNNYKNRHGKYLYETPPGDMEYGSLRLTVTNSEQASTQYIKGVAPSQENSTKNNLFIENCMPYRLSQLGLANYTRIRITVPGNAQIFVGTTLNFFVFGVSPVNKNSKKTEDPYLSGKYLVTAVRHVIRNLSYLTVVELCKDSNIAPFTGVNNEDVSWNSIVKGNQT